MSILFQYSPFMLLLLLPATFFHSSNADIGLASRYSSPYIPTACYGNSEAEFPTNNLFAAAGEGLWDNGASCGRNYLVRCINAPSSAVCNPSKTIQIKIVDRAQTSVSRPIANGALLVLSDTAFSQITTSPGSLINVEFQAV